MNSAIRTLHRQRGMTLIEMMVAMAIGVFLTWGAIEVYVQSKRNYGTSESVARLQENARFALETLEPDIRLAGYWGLHGYFAKVNTPAGLTVSCGGADVSAWAMDFALPVEARDDTYNLPCPAHSVARPGSDVLIVRHASGETHTPQFDQVQVRSTQTDSTLFNDGANQPTSDQRDLVVDAYYVDNSSSFTPGAPSLRRLTLVKGGVFEDQEIVPGVENMQVQFGLDTNEDGAVDRYVDANNPALIGCAGGAIPQQCIVAVRLWLLIRAEDASDRSFTDTRTYTSPDADLPPIVPGGALYPAEFRRIEVTRTIFLPNMSQ